MALNDHEKFNTPEKIRKFFHDAHGDKATVQAALIRDWFDMLEIGDIIECLEEGGDLEEVCSRVKTPNEKSSVPDGYRETNVIPIHAQQFKNNSGPF
ncbi:MAG: hypothetical protein H6860_04690 [Rhodospirillales bacterium]|nr:hypothetical protein [Alphaproteobacteria bacterium]MCB9981678.1 hypothetical protein [Rhodospirillales bacterium]